MSLSPFAILAASVTAPTWAVPSALAAISALLVAGAAWFRRHRRIPRGDRDVRLLFAETPDLMCVTRLDGRIRKSNPAWERVLGYKDSQLGEVRLLDLVLEEDRAAVTSAVEKLHTSPASSQIVVRMLDASGGARWILWSVTTPREEPVIVWSGKDITALKEARINLEHFASSLYSENQTLANSVEEARKTVALKSQLLAQTSHEIRTPMNGIIGMSNLLLDTALTEEQRDFARTICSSSEALLTILSDILDFSKIEAGKLTFEKIPFDLREVVESSVELLGARALEKKIELSCLITNDVKQHFMGDPTRFRQVLLNLIGNAIKFTERGEVAVSVSAGSTGNGELRFEIRDTGIGVSAEALPKLFQAFTQADGSTTRRFGGTGLGLVICKQLVELMGGRIGVESEIGKGSNFWFTVSLSVVDMPQEMSIVAPLPKGLRVLVADDNETNRKILHHYLGGIGLTSVGVGDGDAAIRELRRAQGSGEGYHLAILDVQMPMALDKEGGMKFEGKEME